MTATPEHSEADVQRATEDIQADRERLQAGYDDATAQLGQRIAEREAAGRELSRFRLAAQKTNAYLTELAEDLKHERFTAALAVVDAVTGAEEPTRTEFARLTNLEQLRAEQNRVLAFLEILLTELLPEVEQAFLMAQINEFGAEADQIDALVQVRQLEMQIALAPAAVLEGQIQVVESQTVTGSLVLRAADIRLQAVSLRGRLTELQQKGK